MPFTLCQRRVKMKNFNIHDYVTFKGKDTWLIYMVDKIDFVTSKDKGTQAFCFAKKGKFSIHIGQSILDTKDNELLIQLIQHEIGHGTLGHLNYMSTLKNDLEKQLFNILADCSIHMHIANPKILDRLGLCCTYERQGLPILPPEILFNKLREKIPQLKKWIGTNINDLLWQQEGIPDVEQEIITHTLEQGIKEAQEQGHSLPQGIGAGTEEGQGTDYEFLFEPIKKDAWVDELLRKVRNRLEYTKTTSWRREPHEEIGNGVLKRGYALGGNKNRFLFAIDVSGSMDLEVVKKGLNNILQHTGIHGEQHEVLFFDTRISKTFRVNQVAEILQEANTYGGGTAFSTIFKYAKPEDCLVFFTDGGAYDWNECNKYKNKMTNKPIFVHTGSWYKENIELMGERIPVREW